MIKKSSSFDAQSSKTNSPANNGAKKQLVKVGARISEKVSIGAALSKFASSIRNGIDACIPVVVRSYDRKTHTAVVAPLVKDVDQSAAIPVQTNPSEFKTSVLRLSCGTFLVDIPLNVGDTGWVIASDKDSTIVKSAVTIGSSDIKNQPKPQSPGTLATHKHAFGFFIPDAWGEFPIKNEAGLVLSHIDPKTKRILSEIALNPNNVYIESRKVDVNGDIECTGKIVSLVDVLAENISLKNHSHEIIINDEKVISSKSLPEQEQTKVEIEGVGGGGECGCEVVAPSATAQKGQSADAKKTWELINDLQNKVSRLTARVALLETSLSAVDERLTDVEDWLTPMSEHDDIISWLVEKLSGLDLENVVTSISLSNGKLTIAQKEFDVDNTTGNITLNSGEDEKLSIIPTVSNNGVSVIHPQTVKVSGDSCTVEKRTIKLKYSESANELSLESTSDGDVAFFYTVPYTSI